MTQDPVLQTAKAHFEGANPIFRVDSLTVSLDYYIRVLGFKIRWEAPFWPAFREITVNSFSAKAIRGIEARGYGLA